MRDNDRMHEIAEAAYPPDLLIPPWRYEPFIRLSSVMCRVVEVECEGKFSVEGYYTIVGVARELYDNIAVGAVAEREIADALPFSWEGAEAAYVLEVTATSKGGGKTVWSFMSDVRHLIASQKNISIVGAWAYSREGLRLCELLGMRPTFPGSEFYELNLRAYRTHHRLDSGRL